MPENPHQDLARLKKAKAILIAMLRSGVTHEQATQLPDETWELFASAAGVNTPGTDSRQIVLDDLKMVEIPLYPDAPCKYARSAVSLQNGGER